MGRAPLKRRSIGLARKLSSLKAVAFVNWSAGQCFVTKGLPKHERLSSVAFLNQWGNLRATMIKALLQTDWDYVYTFLRIIAGIIVFPYGMQKLGWFSAPVFGPPGIKGSLEQFKAKKVPKFIAWLVIIGQSFGSIAVISGFLGRIAAGGLFIIFTGALMEHLPDGWAMNWYGSKKGEGVEYFVLLLSLLLVIVVKGSGALSVDSWLIR
jgi:putative oxidoreductase